MSGDSKTQTDREIDEWFESMRRDFRRWYLASDDPWRQSGWGSTPQRWRLAREVILSAVDRSGSFLDIGCANGLLLESLIAWATERGIAIEPHGIDLVPDLVELARQRLPLYARNFAAANAFTWRASRRYDYVHLLLESAPPSRHLEYISRLLRSAVAPRGRLIVSHYGSRSKSESPIDVARYLSEFGFDVTGEAAASERDGFVITRTAWIRNS